MKKDFMIYCVKSLPVYFPYSKPLFILPVSNVRQEFVENHLRNPDRYLYKILFLLRSFSVCLWRTFSKTCEGRRKKETGREFSGLIFGYLLYSGSSLTFLQSKENFESFMEILHSFNLGKTKTNAPSFKNVPDKLSMQATFLGWYL